MGHPRRILGDYIGIWDILLLSDYEGQAKTWIQSIGHSLAAIIRYQVVVFKKQKGKQQLRKLTANIRQKFFLNLISTPTQSKAPNTPSQPYLDNGGSYLSSMA